MNEMVHNRESEHVRISRLQKLEKAGKGSYLCTRNGRKDLALRFFNEGVSISVTGGGYFCGVIRDVDTLSVTQLY